MRAAAVCVALCVPLCAGFASSGNGARGWARARRAARESRRDAIGDAAFAEVARFAPDVADCVVHREVHGPPDVEARIGLTGGHIFQGDCTPERMWSNRPDYRTELDSVYLCGAGTYPGGSVIAVNGRNAAMRVIREIV